MKLWLITCPEELSGWDRYDSAVVAAESEEVARKMNPHDGSFQIDTSSWCKPEQVIVQHIGEANPGQEREVICASYNAG